MNCPTCGQPILTADNGLTLNPKPGRLGRFLKDGTTLTGNQIRTPGMRAYYQHHCLPGNTKTNTKQSQPEQTLF